MRSFKVLKLMSSWYRTIDAGMWGDEKFRKLSRPQPNAQFLWVYLLTGAHTEGLPGLYAVGEAALAEALGWTVEELRPVFAELRELGMALADITARVIYLPNAIKYQAPCNQKHLQSLGKHFHRIPECELKTRWLAQLYEYAESQGEPYIEAFMSGFDTVWHTVCDRVSPPNPNPNPKPNPQPNPNKELSGKPDGIPPGQEPDIPFAEIVGYLNERAGKRFRNGRPQTRTHIRARWAEGYRIEDFKQVIDTKVAEWLGTDMEKHLCPDTLFGSKFEKYLNSKGEGTSVQGSQYRDMNELMDGEDNADSE